MTEVATKTTEGGNGDTANMKSKSRKRSSKDQDDDNKGKTDELNPKTTSSARRRNRKKRQKISQARSSVNPDKPLAGLVLSVSTLKDKVKTKIKNSSKEVDDGNDNASISYNEVCQSCRDLGADVIDLVCKRVNILICTKAAVRQATQRVRKAIKRNKPLVSVDWVKQCRIKGRKVDFEDYRLEKAENVVKNQLDQSRSSRVEDYQDDSGLEAIPDSGWSEPQELGCCCVCHENGTTADCSWCVDCKV